MTHHAAHDSSGSTPLYRDVNVLRLGSVGLLGSLARWLEMLAFGVFTYQQTRSAFWVASMTMLRMLPLTLFGVAFGTLAARVSRRSGLLATQCMALAAALVLLVVSALGALEVWHLAVAAFVSGIHWAGDLPLRRGLIGDEVGPLRMGEAMALDAVVSNGSRLAGPSLGGLLLAGGGMTAVLAVDALLYAIALGALLGLPDRGSAHRHEAPGSGGGSGWATVVAGLQAARQSPPLMATLYVTLVFNIFCWPVTSMIPVIGQERLQLGPGGVGLLASTDGLGALLGAIVLSALARHLSHGAVYVGGTFVYLLMMPVFALSVHPLLSGLALLVLGVGQAGFAVMQSTLVFVTAPPQRRFEAMGLMTTCIGIASLGFALIGWLAERIGATGATVACAAGGLVTLASTRKIWMACTQGGGGAAPARTP